MQRMSKLVAAGLLVVGGNAASAGVSAASGVTPVQKVVQLMEGMLAKGKKEKNDEEVQFATYKQFCEDTSGDKKRAIGEADEEIEVLQADIEKSTATAEKLTKEIAEHEEDISVWKGDQRAATKVRELEKADYDAMHKDYSESIDALTRAIAVLKKQSHDRPQASLLQLSALKNLPLVPDSVKTSISAFLQVADPAEGLEVTAPEAHGYEFQSQGVIEMLEKLQDKFMTERTDLEKTEVNDKHAFDMLMQELTAQIGQAEQDRDEKSEAKAKSLQAKADAEGDLGDTSSTRKADNTYMEDLVATCEQKATDFAARQELRAEEIEAVNKAIEIISSNAVKGNADKHLPTLVQQGSALAMLRADMRSGSATQGRVANFLREQAKRLDSRVLSALATHCSSDPFEKVQRMIRDLITRLMEEANEEAEHKGWCDTELATNEQTRKQKTQSVEMLHAEIDQLETSIAKISEELTELTQQVAELDKAMAKATKLRNDEREKNTQTVSDAQEAQTAVAQALTVLQQFYEKAGEATALLQQQPEAPEIFDAPYKGMGGESGGIIGMLEVIESDFARLESDTKASEASAQKEYDTFMGDSKIDKESKSKDIEHRTAKKQDESQALTVKREDLEATQKELDAALSYFDKLKPSCIDAGVSYEDRVARRKEEIVSLQDALRILNGEDTR